MNELWVRSWGRVLFTAESLPAAVIALITWFYTSFHADDLWIYVWSALSRTLRSPVFNYFSGCFTQKLRMAQITLSRTWGNPASAEALEILPTSLPLTQAVFMGERTWSALPMDYRTHSSYLCSLCSSSVGTSQLSLT